MPVLRGHQEVFGGVASLEMDMDPHFSINVLEAFTYTLCVGYHHIDVTVVVAAVVVIVLASVMVVVDLNGAIFVGF